MINIYRAHAISMLIKQVLINRIPFGPNLWDEGVILIKNISQTTGHACSNIPSHPVQMAAWHYIIINQRALVKERRRKEKHTFQE